MTPHSYTEGVAFMFRSTQPIIDALQFIGLQNQQHDTHVASWRWEQKLLGSKRGLQAVADLIASGAISR